MWNLSNLIELINTQLKNMFLYSDTQAIAKYAKPAYNRALICFSESSNKYFHSDSNNGLREYHSGQYSIYLWYLSNEAYKAGDIRCADVVCCLNKSLHGVDWFYAIELPEFWSVEHPLGAIMGRAKYSNYFFFYQGCTVGGNNNAYPIIGEYVAMLSNSKILGNATIGHHVILAANSYVIDEDIPDYCIVFGQSPNLTIKIRNKEEMAERFKQFWRTK